MNNGADTTLVRVSEVDEAVKAINGKRYSKQKKSGINEHTVLLDQKRKHWKAVSGSREDTDAHIGMYLAHKYAL